MGNTLPIDWVTVSGHEFPFLVEENILMHVRKVLDLKGMKHHISAEVLTILLSPVIRSLTSLACILRERCVHRTD
jgi:hypothetical protein